MGWPILDVKTLAWTPWMRFRQDTVMLPSGKKQDFAYLERAAFVVVISFTSDDQVVFVEHYRPAVQKSLLQLPMGLMELTDVSPVDAARRELAEETGYTARMMDLLGQFDLAPGCINQVGHVCVARMLTPGEQNLDPAEEDIKVKLFPYTYLKDLIKNSVLRDGPSLAALAYFQNV